MILELRGKGVYFQKLWVGFETIRREPEDNDNKKPFSIVFFAILVFIVVSYQLVVSNKYHHDPTQSHHQ